MAVADLTSAGVLWLQYKKISNVWTKMLNLETEIVNPIISGQEYADLKSSLEERINWLIGDYDFDFDEAPIVRESLLSEQNISNMAIWAVPALAVLSIISSLLDIGIFIATSSTQSEFSTLFAAILCYIKKI